MIISALIRRSPSTSNGRLTHGHLNGELLWAGIATANECLYRAKNRYADERNRRLPRYAEHCA
jgi:hypothetical protein